MFCGASLQRVFLTSFFGCKYSDFVICVACVRSFVFSILHAHSVRDLITFLYIFVIHRVCKIAVSLAPIGNMSQKLYETPVHRCWKCPAPIKVTSHGSIKYMRCKNDECGLVAHPACAVKGGCCEVPDYEEVNERAKKITPGHMLGPFAAAGKVGLDASFIISPSATGNFPNLAPPYASSSCANVGVSSSSTATTVTTTFAHTRTPAVVTTISSLCSTHPIVMPARLGNTPTKVKCKFQMRQIAVKRSMLSLREQTMLTIS